jgi:hypothetical protein
MKVVNIHSRIINQPKAQVAKLLQTLAGRNDMIWPQKHWPAMRFKEGLCIGAHGGHGPIRYAIEDYQPDHLIRFKFTQPSGFDGTHTLLLNTINEQQTEIKHEINMYTTGISTFSWLFAIRWLHDALLEDAFDKVENYFSGQNKRTPWNWWVKVLRTLLQPKTN